MLWFCLWFLILIFKILRSQLWAGLRFTVPRLKDTHKTVQFYLQIRRYTMNILCFYNAFRFRVNSTKLIANLNVLFYFIFTVKMKITPKVRLFTTTPRWWSRLMSSCRGEFSYRDPLIWTSFSLQFLPADAFITLLLFSSVSRPDKVFFPPANWKVPKSYGVEQDVGPAVEHIYEVISQALICAHSAGTE